MSRLASIVRDTRLYPLWVLLIAGAVLFVRLGSYGFWEPHEIQVADRAHDIANPSEDTEADVDAPPAAKKKARSKPAHKQTRSELSAELVARAISAQGRGEGSSRGPLALLALLTILATYFIGLRVGGPRAGLFAAIMLLGFPALLMHGRHLTSEIGSAAGSALVALGLLGLISRRGFGFRDRARPSIYLIPIDAALVVGGALLSYHAAGALVGVLPPFAGVGVAAAMFALHQRRETGDETGDGDGDGDGDGENKREDKLERHDRLRLGIAAGVGILAASLAFVMFFTGVFDLVDPDEINQANEDKIKKGALIEPAEGYLILGGQDLEIEDGYVPELAGVWRASGDRRVGFSSTLENIAIGSFPWIAMLPIAMIALLIGRGGKERAARVALPLWALAAFIVGAIFARKVGASMYPAWGALAAAGGVWLSDTFANDRQRPIGEDDGLDSSLHGALPLAAFFVVCAAVVVGKDILAFPEKLTELNLTGGKLEFPKGVGEHFTWVAVGWATALCLGVALATRDLDGVSSGRIGRIIVTARRWAQRGGLQATLILGLVGATFFAQVVTPALSEKLSAKNILGVYKSLRVDGDVLGIMGRAGGASYYAGGEFERIRGRSQLLEFLERPERVFALAPTSERCPLNKAARKKNLPYYVVDDESAQFLLFSNQLKKGEVDVNPLKGTFFAEAPTDIRKPLSWNLDDRLELVGVSMPDSVRKGATFKMKLYFKVVKPISRNWKIFVHFDTGVRFQADHDPIGGTCGSAYWLPGDYVVDEFEVQAGSRTHPSGSYKVWVGLFVGSAGNYTNMKVVTKGADTNNRIPIGTLKLK